jgi:ribonuclease VapC
MVVDTSALIAILSDEPEAPGLEAAIEADSVRLLSAASLVEAAIEYPGQEARNGL